MSNFSIYRVGNKLALSGGNVLRTKILPLISGGQYHSILNDFSDYTVWGWGNNNSGQLGDNTILPKCIPISTLGQKKIFQTIASNEGTSFGLTSSGVIWGWGINNVYYLGDGSTINKCTPVSIHGTKKTFCKITAGAIVSSGIDHKGQIWCWGWGFRGTIGDNDTAIRCTPVSIYGTKKTFCEISSGREYMSSLDKNGMVWSWGHNAFGQLGDNSTTNRCTPVSIHGAKKTFCYISATYNHTYAIDINNQVWGWGLNNYGIIGDNSVTVRYTPVSIHGTKKTFCHITGGYTHSVGIDTVGQIWGWGGNQYGQIGDNTTTSRRTPVSIHGSKKTFCYIAAGWFHSLGVEYNGNLWSWGNNFDGQLGDNSTTSRRTPVRVCNL